MTYHFDFYTTVPANIAQETREFAFQTQPFDHAFRLPYIGNQYNADKSLPSLFTVRQDENLVGFLTIYADEVHQAEITAMIAPNHRRQGLFTALKQLAEPHLNQHGVTDITYYSEQHFVDAHPAIFKSFTLPADSPELVMVANDVPAQSTLPNEKITVRQAMLADAKAIARVNFRSFPDEETEEMALAYAQNTLQDPKAKLFVLSYENQLIGTVSSDFTGLRHYLFGVAIDPDFRRRGFAAYLLGETMRQLALVTPAAFELLVDADNLAALPLYEKLGFVAKSHVLYFKSPIV